MVWLLGIGIGIVLVLIIAFPRMSLIMLAVVILLVGAIDLFLYAQEAPSGHEPMTMQVGGAPER